MASSLVINLFTEQMKLDLWKTYRKEKQVSLEKKYAVIKSNYNSGVVRYFLSEKIKIVTPVIFRLRIHLPT